MFSPLSRASLGAVLFTALATAPLAAQEASQLRVTPAELTLPVGKKATLKVEILDTGGRPVDGRVIFFSRARRSLRVEQGSGELTAIRPGVHEIVVRSIVNNGARGPEAVVSVTVPKPEPASLEVNGVPEVLYVGTALRVTGRVLDDNGVNRADLGVDFTVNDVTVAGVDAFGFLVGRKPGKVELTATGGGLTELRGIEVVENPVRSIMITTSDTEVRTGDVLQFEAVLRDAAGQGVEGVPVEWAFIARPDDRLGNAATGQIDEDGRFVAEKPGLYTIYGSCGTATSQLTIRANERLPNKKKLVKIGHGPVLDVHTSDLWVWEGSDGRDYAVTGTWGANGDALFWDVTDPADLQQISKVTVDARTVNDVKINGRGDIAVISREGASNRKNGLVILDVKNPREPKVLAEYDDELTGGVHNVYIDGDFIYALSAGRRYDVISIEDPSKPKRVGSFQLFEPGASIHDVWIKDGIAFSSNWRYGLRLVDVGNGIAGGSPENPVEFAHYAYPNGWNHAAFPWTSPDTGKFYVVAGDEAFPYGLSVDDNPTYPRGWIHFIDFSDLKNPKEVARYEVPEAGTHNLWIEGNTLYVAYYNAGLRVVDISGDLMGDLYQQGREIAWYLPTHPKGRVPNAPMAWGPQPYKGHIFFSDWNSGLWSVKLVDDNGRRR